MLPAKTLPEREQRRRNDDILKFFELVFLVESLYKQKFTKYICRKNIFQLRETITWIIILGTATSSLFLDILIQLNFSGVIWCIVCTYIKELVPAISLEFTRIIRNAFDCQ